MGKLAYAFGRQVSKLSLTTLFRFSVSGRENIPASGGFIIAGNHESYLDPPIVGVACTRPVIFMAKKELFEVPVVGSLINAVRAFPVDRGASDLSAIKKAIRYLRAGEVLGIFPEGGRQEYGLESHAERGVGFLAVRAQVPVVPVFIRGSGMALPKDSKPRWGTKISARIGAPLVFDKQMGYQEAADRVMEAICGLA